MAGLLPERVTRSDLPQGRGSRRGRQRAPEGGCCSQLLLGPSRKALLQVNEAPLPLYNPQELWLGIDVYLPLCPFKNFLNYRQ